MLAFIDESGDLGFRIERGSTRFFTIAIVVFDDSQHALACQRAIEQLRDQLRLPPRYEFHFHEDSHKRRLAFLSTISIYHFSAFTFTLDKASPRLTGRGFRYRDSAYKWVCRIALENVADALEDATVVIDGSGDRQFKRQLQTYLKRELNNQESHKIRKVKVSRSHSDPLVQLADYVAGVTNRLYEGKSGADAYDAYLRRKRRSQRRWP